MKVSMAQDMMRKGRRGVLRSAAGLTEIDYASSAVGAPVRRGLESAVTIGATLIHQIRLANSGHQRSEDQVTTVAVRSEREDGAFVQRGI